MRKKSQTQNQPDKNTPRKRTVVKQPKLEPILVFLLTLEVLLVLAMIIGFIASGFLVGVIISLIVGLPFLIWLFLLSTR